MLTGKDYEAINKFKDSIHRNHFLESNYTAFRKQVCINLQVIFGYEHVIFGYLDMVKEKEYSLNILVHNLKDRFVERFYSSGVLSEHEMKSTSNVIKFSETDSYRKKLVCRSLMSEFGYADFLVDFLNIDSLYNGYLIVFNEKKKGCFTHRDREIFDAISQYIAVEYFNCLKVLQLRNTNSMLKEQFNRYPIGVVIMADVTSMTYANDTALEYMQELGISSLKYFSIFYNNHLMPYIKNNILANNKKNLIRYKNFIFNVMFSMTHDKGFFEGITNSNLQEPAELQITRNQTTGGYVYIFKDEYSVFSKSSDYFEEYSFTPKEQLIAEQLIMGKDAATIADDLRISMNTVKVHIRNLYRKANVNSRAEFIFKMNNR